MTQIETRITVVTVEPQVDPAPHVHHDNPYVAQLIANATGLSDTPQRRRSDRVAPLRAYTAQPLQTPKTRQIV